MTEEGATRRGEREEGLRDGHGEGPSSGGGRGLLGGATGGEEGDTQRSLGLEQAGRVGLERETPRQVVERLWEIKGGDLVVTEGKRDMLPRNHPQSVFSHPERFGTVGAKLGQSVIKVHLTPHTTRFSKEESEYMRFCIKEAARRRNKGCLQSDFHEPRTRDEPMPAFDARAQDPQ